MESNASGKYARQRKRIHGTRNTKYTLGMKVYASEDALDKLEKGIHEC